MTVSTNPIIPITVKTCSQPSAKVSQPSSGENNASEKYCAALKIAEAVPRSLAGNQAATMRALAGNEGASEKPSIKRIQMH
jgi:hypothetical protein